MSADGLSLFISDLHLEPGRADITEAFQHFLTHTATAADSLYILGDLFNVWIGDDAANPFSDAVAAALRQVADAGTKIYFMHGNRDFLLGADYAQRAGMSILEEPSLVTIHGRRYLLMHGDSMCTRDEEYMQFRQLVRNPQWQQWALSLTVPERIRMAGEARAKSKTMTSTKAEDIMDVTPSEVVRVMNQYQVPCLIHGHTHRPAQHSVMLGEKSIGTRIVLGDWNPGGRCLKIDASGIHGFDSLSHQSGPITM